MASTHVLLKLLNTYEMALYIRVVRIRLSSFGCSISQISLEFGFGSSSSRWVIVQSRLVATVSICQGGLIKCRKYNHEAISS